MCLVHLWSLPLFGVHGNYLPSLAERPTHHDQRTYFTNLLLKVRSALKTDNRCVREFQTVLLSTHSRTHSYGVPQSPKQLWFKNSYRQLQIKTIRVRESAAMSGKTYIPATRQPWKRIRGAMTNSCGHHSRNRRACRVHDALLSGVSDDEPLHLRWRPPAAVATQ